MTEPLHPDEVPHRLIPYLTTLYELLRAHGLPYGTPGAVTVFADRILAGTAFREHTSALLLTMLEHEWHAVGEADLLAFLTVAIGGSRIDTSTPALRRPIREITGLLSEMRKSAGFERRRPLVRSQDVIDEVRPASAPTPLAERMPIAAAAPGTETEPKRGDIARADALLQHDMDTFREEAGHSGARRSAWTIAAGGVAIGLLAGLLLRGHDHAVQPHGEPQQTLSGSLNAPSFPDTRLHQRPARPLTRQTVQPAGTQSSVPRRATARMADGPTHERHAAPAEAKVARQEAMPTRSSSQSTSSQSTRSQSMSSLSTRSSGVSRPPRPTLTASAKRSASAGMTDTARSGPQAGSSPLQHETVVPGSAGIMAANLLSSPAPSYPQQASASLVQGEVVIQAVVGRDGSVLETRLVSGPPLLREAALDAVQRWRYRPYLVEGRPTEIATTAIVDFRLTR